MSDYWIIDNAYFEQIKTLGALLNEAVLKQFINDVVYKHPSSGILLRNLSDIYVLVASYGAHSYLNNGEKTWNNFLDTQHYELLKCNRKLIIGYMLINDHDRTNSSIEIYGNILINHDIFNEMITRYKKTKNYIVTVKCDL
tara:strand:- start:956 stop:1378 length:423 start_codon:yes stop_codon:yes gene_type:complete